MSEDDRTPAPPDPRFPRRSDEGHTSASQFAGIGIQFAVAIVLFLYLGQWVDRKLGTAPWFLLLFVFLGAGGAFYGMYRKLMAAQEREEQAARERRARGEPPR
jgi:F0F1-type ATP synthase assembly protein I